MVEQCEALAVSTGPTDMVSLVCPTRFQPMEQQAETVHFTTKLSGTWEKSPERGERKQTGAELCQAQAQLGVHAKTNHNLH
jgi:hypothetical protein